MKSVRKGDKISAFLFVSIVFGFSVFLSLSELVFNANIDFGAQKRLVEQKFERQSKFRDLQEEYISVCHILYERINKYNPSVYASFEEEDIKFMINDLKNIYQNNDRRYKAFYHIACYYEMWFTDKKILWSKKQNVNKFKTELESCKLELLNLKQNNINPEK